jgi:MinD-like ATPase involved in chromosome partitioning or flagellar assembly
MAAAIAEKGKSVTLIDADMEGGTVLASLGLGQSRDRSIDNILNTSMTSDALLAQTIGVPGYGGLRVIPGYRGGRYGPELTDPLHRMEHGIRSLPDDYVFIDCGHPLSHAGIKSPQEVLNALGLVSDKVFVVVRDEPAFVVHALDCFRKLQFEQGQWGDMYLVICEQRKGRMRDQVRQTYARGIGNADHLPLLAGWSWNERQAAKAIDQSRPYPMGDLPRRLGLISG